MKLRNWFICLLSIIVIGCAQTTQFMGDIASQQAYDKAYKKAFNKAMAEGMSQEKAHAYAEKIAAGEAAQKRQLFEGIGDVITSTGDVPYDQEMIMGETLALEGFKRYGMPVDNHGLQQYVNLVGNALARNSDRPDIPYYFVVVDSPLYNAFACPGGIIFVSSALVRSMRDEAELAGVLAHEISHVTHKHALKSLKRAKFFAGGAKIATSNMEGEKGQQYQEMIGELQTILFDQGLDQSMEYEADVTGMEIAYRTGYDPEGLLRVLLMLQGKEAHSQKAGSWFSTHPPLTNRIAKCRTQMLNYSDAADMATVKGRFLDEAKGRL